MSEASVTQVILEIRMLMEERMRIKGHSLAQQLHKSGRRLPRKVRKAAQKLAQVEPSLDHPKLSRMLDQVALHRAAETVVTYLKGIDPRDQMIGKVLVVLGKISAVLILGFIAVVWYLVSTGRV
jgi:hypothetical protein